MRVPSDYPALNNLPCLFLLIGRRENEGSLRKPSTINYSFLFSLKIRKARCDYVGRSNEMEVDYPPDWRHDLPLVPSYLLFFLQRALALVG